MDLLSAPREIEIRRDRGHGVDVGAHRSAQSNSSEGQRAVAATKGGWVSATKKNLRVRYVVSTFNIQTLNMFYYFRVITESTVMVSSPVKICAFYFFIFFIFTVGMSNVSEPRRRHIGAVSEPCRRSEKKRKRKGHRRTPKSSASYLFRCPTRVGHGHNAKNGVSVQLSTEYANIKILTNPINY